MEIQDKVLIHLNKNNFLDSYEFSKEENLDHQSVIGLLKSLESLDDWQCTEEGIKIINEGSHEAKLFKYISSEGKSLDDIKTKFLADTSFAIGAAMKNKWIKKEGNLVIPIVASIIDEVHLDLSIIDNGNADSVPVSKKQDYKRRKLIKEVDITIFEATPSNNFTTSIKKQETELTKELIETGKWKEKSFKPYNFSSKGKIEHRSGYLHPLMQVRAEFRQIFLELGFTEMQTNNFVESAFWNFDALFQPQQHPARDILDTFYVSDPASALYVPEKYLEKVKNVHSVGGFGSTGYRCPWSIDEAYKNLLRTHTTAVSARVLHKLAKEGFKPAKYFSIDRVFRNETLDSTHLAEFHQIEGIVVDYNLSVKHLMGTIAAFFEKIGITKLRFKPAYNPYTEPSMEIFSFHEGLKKWVEIGNSGLFRPEMLLPMGLPKNVTAIAWGLSLERPTMIIYGINNIRELVGPRVKMELIQGNPICSTDKFGKKKKTQQENIERLFDRQNAIFQKLKKLQKQVCALSQSFGVSLEELPANHSVEEYGVDIVIYAHPHRPPYSLKAMVLLLMESYSVCTLTTVHCSIAENNQRLINFWNECSSIKERSTDCSICITLIWHQTPSNSKYLPSMCVSPMSNVKIAGEHNICRYMMRLIPQSTVAYESKLNSLTISKIDNFIEECHYKLAFGSKRDQSGFLKKMESCISQQDYLVDSQLSLADILVLSTLLQLNLLEMKSLHSWVQRCLLQNCCKVVMNIKVSS